MDFFRKPVFLHLTGSLIFLLLPALLHPDFSLDLHFITLPHFQKTFFLYSLLLLFFYAHYYFLIPKLAEQKKYLLYALLLIAFSIAVIAFMHYFLKASFAPMQDRLPNGPGRGHGPPHGPRLNVMKEIFQFLPPFLAAIFLSFFIRSRTNLREAQKAKLTGELDLLRSKIDPHFLFNSLNSIYALSLQNSEKMSDAVLHLSEMMRYVLYETKEEKVALEKELQYISSYIEMNRLRLSPNIELEFKLEGKGQGQEIAPMILIPFIENVFKHGLDTEKKIKINIDIHYTPDQIELRTENPIATKNTVKGSGLGVDISLKRLKLIYGKHFTYKQRTEENKYYLQLTIQLK